MQEPEKYEIDDNQLAQARKRMEKCTFRMFQDFPFWAFLLEKCNIKLTTDSRKIPTACVDRNANIYMDYRFFKESSDSFVHFVLAHEVMHMMLDHHNRVGGRDARMWNVAGDVLINEMLQDHFHCKAVPLDLTGYITASSFDFPVDHNTTTTEQVYDELQKSGKKVGQKGNKGKGQGQDNDIGSASDLGDFEPGDSPDGHSLKDASEDTPMSGKEWADAGLEAATRSRMAGNCPAFMERQIDRMLNPQVPWNEVLAYYLRNKFCMSSRIKHTFTPPNRRYLHQDIILTSRTGNKKPSIAFSIDTSGSMSPQDISKGVAEVDAIRKMYKVPVYLLEADYAVHKARWIAPHEEIPSLTGGGGTSFEPVMNHIRDNKPDVDVLVYFTDGYGQFGPAPDFDVLWVLNSDVKVPYGTTIRIS